MKRLLAALSLSALTSVAFADAGQSHAQVARRFALGLDGSAAYYTLAVPQTVYAASLRNDLGDLRVFNGAGEPVPYSLDAPPPVAAPPQTLAVHWFPLPPSGAAAGVATGGVPLGVSIAADGSLRATAAAPSRANRSADLVDVSAVGGAVDALLIHLRNDSYQGRVHVDASDDLRNWQPLTDTQLLKVSSEGRTLTQERIALDGVRQRYLRLSWLDGAPAIAGAAAEFRSGDGNAPDGTALPRQWRDGVTMRAGAAAGEYLFDTDGAYPVDRLRVDLPQPNTIAHATIQSRENAQAPWRDVADGVLFRLQGKAGEQRNPPLAFAPDADRAWRIVVDMRNGGLGGGMPAVSVGWHPASLTFVARGAPPFALGVGNASLESAAVGRDALLIGATSVVGSARVGDALPSPAAPPAAGDPDAKRRYVLWAALLVAVGVLGTIAWRLARDGGNRDREGR
ncbi:DUF3999 domain-containing protein [Burkholderia guangdongensis]|uniref:DUF3999 domain-containing protein n=1 Tax=Burkholderia guangdongensis TaxID=1792500 RepID=UPI0015C9D584|nr:DUF3999 domain-containing protein [Burkholderia guangdongensis]